MTRQSLRGYSGWCAVSSYFDGDGTVEIQVSKLTLRFKLSWADNWRNQLEQIKRFLEAQGIVCERVVYAKGAWHLVIGRIDSLRRAAAEMLQSGCSYKKRRELSALVSYYDNRLTGDRVIGEFNWCVREGIRSGFERTSRLPLTYKGAKRLQARLAGERARVVHQKVDPTLRSIIVDERVRLGLSVKKLALKHELSKTTISRVLREAFRTPRLGRVGDQDTLD